MSKISSGVANGCIDAYQFTLPSLLTTTKQAITSRESRNDRGRVHLRTCADMTTSSKKEHHHHQFERSTSLEQSVSPKSFNGGGGSYS